MTTNPLGSSRFVPAPDSQKDDADSLPRDAVRIVDSTRAPVGSGRSSSAPTDQKTTEVSVTVLTGGSPAATSQPPPANFHTRVQLGNRK